MNPTSIFRVSGKSELGRRFTVITLMFLGVLLGIMVYTTMTIQKQKSNALLIDMTGRQRMLFEKHLNEVYLTSQGIPADYKSTRELLRSTLASLMKGGSVTLDPETGKSQTIPAAPTEELLLKLHEQENHFDKVIESSNSLLMLSPDFPEFYRTLKNLRTQNSTLIRIADQTVKLLIGYSESNISTMVYWEVGIAIFAGLLGVFVTGHGIRESRKLEKEIDERKRAESASRDSELFLKSIVENIPDMIFVKDAKSLQFLRFNKAGEELVGHPKEAMIGKTDYDFFPQSEADFYTTKDREVLTSKTLIDIPEEVIQTKSHGTRYLHTKKIPILDEHGIPLYLLGISEDITERKTSEQQAKRLSRQNELILASTGSGIYGLDLEGQTTFVNPAGAKLLGYTPQELIGRPMHTLVHHTKTDGSPYPKQECPTYAAFTDGAVHKVEDEVLWRKDGTSFPVEYTSTPIWQDGNLAGVVVTFQDVTERKQAEITLRATEQMYRQILDAIPDMVLVKDRNYRLFWANKAFRSYYNMTNEELKGILDSPINKPDFTKQYNKDDYYVLNTGKVLDIPEEPVTRHDGHVALFHTIKAPLFGENGEVVKSVGVSRDITERKQTEERLHQSEAKEKEALLQSDELKSALLSSVSHELRTPLTTMKGSVSSIMEDGSGSNGHKRQEVLKGIDREIDYMSQLVNNLLDMSQIEAGTLIPHKEWHLLEDLVEGALHRTEQILDTRDLDIHIPENAPPIFVDAVQIQQVLINLLDNAVKYSLPASPIRLNIRIEAQNIAVEASNEGEPLQPQDLELLFDRFYRQPPPREQPIHGTGLGLAICKGLVEAHGGRIWAESIGRKVTITFTIPTTEHMASFSLEGRQKSKWE